MAHPSARKGSRAELEIASILAEHTGQPVRRKLGAGRQDDTGDLVGFPGVTIEIKNYRNVTDAINDGLTDLEREMRNSGDPLGVCFVRRPGGRWIAVMDVPMWCTWWREATQP